MSEMQYQFPGVSAETKALVDTCGKNVLVFLYDCTTDTSRQIRSVQSIPIEVCDQIARAYQTFAEGEEDYGLFEKHSLDLLGLKAQECSVSDDRISAAMAYIRAMAPEKMTCRQAAEAAYLSQGRFSHLFKEQTGMTFAAYLIYQRIMYAYGAVFRGTSITDAALQAGFSGSAHFADINRRLFGLPMSSIMRDLVLKKIG